MKNILNELPFPWPLKIIQALNYICVFLSPLVGLPYLILPNDHWFLLNSSGEEPINKYIAGILYLLLSVLLGVSIVLIRRRKKIARIAFVIMIMLSIPMGEIVSHYANLPLSNLERSIYYAMDAVVVTYFVYSEQLKHIFTAR